MTTTWTKAEYRSPAHREPIFRAGDTVTSCVQCAGGIVTLPTSAESMHADLLLVAERPDQSPELHAFQFHPRNIERGWALFGLRLIDADCVELWLRDGREFFYGAPRRAEYRIAVLRPGDVTRVLHNAKNDFSAAAGRERTYRWNDFVFELLGRPAAPRYADTVSARAVPLDNVKTVDLREDLL